MWAPGDSSCFCDLPAAVSSSLGHKYIPSEKILSLNLDYFSERWINVLAGE